LKRRAARGEDRYLLSPRATFQVQRDQVRASLGQVTLLIPRRLYAVVLAFAEPSTIAAVRREHAAGISLAQFSGALQPLIDNGHLQRERSGADPVTLLDRLNPAVWKPRGFVERLTRQLRAGQACVIRDAFRPAYARRIADDLASAPGWSPSEKWGPFFGYKAHGLDNPELFPESFRQLRSLFDSPATKRTVEAWTGVACQGPVRMAGSLYLPGDYALPHQDRAEGRRVSFIWYLTRGWSSSWGGQLFWCPTGQFLMPTFNMLVLFRTSNRSQHLVCPVAPTAAGHRLTVNGWWTTDRPSRVSDDDRRAKRQSDWVYGKPLKKVAPNLFVIR
jgi:hypothetical protein